MEGGFEFVGVVGGSMEIFGVDCSELQGGCTEEGGVQVDCTELGGGEGGCTEKGGVQVACTELGGVTRSKSEEGGVQEECTGLGEVVEGGCSEGGCVGGIQGGCGVAGVMANSPVTSLTGMPSVWHSTSLNICSFLPFLLLMLTVILNSL